MIIMATPTLSLQMSSDTNQLQQYKFFQNHNHQAAPVCKVLRGPVPTRLPSSLSSSKEILRFQDNEDFELQSTTACSSREVCCGFFLGHHECSDGSFRDKNFQG